jgi:glycosyltransferase involved in cell wall biosynthesis
MSSVDVIVPCYNYGRFLRDCVESVLKQSHADLRVVIIDDASTDDTPAVCATLAAQDSRVEVVRHPVNLGHIATYNEGIALAIGDCLLLLSADDLLLPGALARAVAVFDGRPDIGLVYGDMLMYRSGDMLPLATDRPAVVQYPDSASLIVTLAKHNIIGCPTVLVRTSLQKTLGGYRRELPHAGDLEMWLRFAVHSKVAYIPTQQTAYRRHDANMSLAYDRVADFRQCLLAFELNYHRIRTHLPHGTVVEMRARRAFARRALKCAVYLLKRGRDRTATVFEFLHLWGREHRAALALQWRSMGAA